MPIKPISAPIAAEVRPDTESESALIQRAKKSISASSWEVGECASMWTARWARGRTDEDFGNLIGMSGEQVGQRRRVWDRWGGKSDLNPKLSWTHFYVAVAWDDADTCLQWAYEQEATVAEMKAWRAAQNGLSKAADGFLSGMGEPVDDADPFDGDPFGEGDEESGTDAGGGTEDPGTDSEEEHGANAPTVTRPPRNGREVPGVKKPTADPFVVLKSKAVKTIESAMRVIDDVDGVRKVPQHDAMIKALRKMLETVKTW